MQNKKYLSLLLIVVVAVVVLIMVVPFITRAPEVSPQEPTPVVMLQQEVTLTPTPQISGAELRQGVPLPHKRPKNMSVPQRPKNAPPPPKTSKAILDRMTAPPRIVEVPVSEDIIKRMTAPY